MGRAEADFDLPVDTPAPATEQERIQAAVDFTYQTLNEWGLHGWKVTLMNQQRVMGQCDSRSKTILLSRMHMGAPGNQDSVRNTILHEVAHALHSQDPQRARHAPHGPQWKAWALKVGATPSWSGKSNVIPSLKGYDKRFGTPVTDARYGNASIGVRIGDAVSARHKGVTQEVTITKSNRTTMSGVDLDGNEWRLQKESVRRGLNKVLRFDVDGEMQDNPHVVSF